MKILLSESQFNLIRNLDKKVNQIYFNNLVENVLLEANKKDILVNKLGIKEQIANQIYQLTGNLAVWMTKKIIAFYMSYHNKSKDDAIKHINSNIFYRGKIVGIMDWIRVGLNGNIKPYDNLNFDELYDKSKEWHDSLQIGDSKIDYVEEREIVVDLREGDEGFYWVDLETNKCTEEGERMGHCASSEGNLYSLREYKKIPNDHTLNKSHLTASITDDGKLLQLKGPVNSKPKPEYHKYIIQFLLAKYQDDDLESMFGREYIVDSFSYEYESKNDFKLTDLSEEHVKYLYAKRPELFSGRAMRLLLVNYGIIDAKKTYDDYIHINPNEILDFVHVIGDNDYYEEMTVDNNFFINLFHNPEFIPQELLSDIDVTNLDSFDFIDDENENIIKYYLKNNPNYDENDLDSPVGELIHELDDEGVITDAIYQSMKEIMYGHVNDELINNLKLTLSNYGTITEFNEKGVKIKIDWIKIQAISNNDIDDSIEDYEVICRGDIKCVLRNMSYEQMDKPQYNVYVKYEPLDTNIFNYTLKDKLYKLISP
jgi:hypothetical protein